MFENYDIEVCNVFKKAEKYKEELNHEYVGTEHLLLAILDTDKSLASSLSHFNLNFKSFWQEVELNESKTNRVTSYNEYTPLLKRVILLAKNESAKVTPKDLLYQMLNIGEGVAIRIMMNLDIDVDEIYHFLKNSEENLEIYKYGTNLNKTVSLKDKVIGRDKEINLIIETLLRRKKNNPLLVGDAGVGKSAIVEQLARQIVLGDVPESIKDYIIVQLDMPSLLAGTRYRGEFEERLTKIINEVKEQNNIILFIDEVHTMVGAGAAEGAISASDILKPYLARGDIKCIAATTKKEYEKSIAEDKALNRRFECILVVEPDEEETYKILQKVKNEYESFHKVSFSDELLMPLIHMASLYFPSKKNPDRSLELLDSVMSYVKLKEAKRVVQNKELELKKLNITKIKMVESGNYKGALKTGEMARKMEKELAKLKSGNCFAVKKDDIIDVLEYKNNIILSKNKIKRITGSLKESYEPKALNLIMNTLKSKNTCSSFLISGEYKEFPKDLAKSLNYEIFNLDKEEDIPKLFHKVKYYPSQVIIASSNANPKIEKLLNKIIKDKLVEYEDEYYSFNNAIVLLIDNSNNIGFLENKISNIPVDKIIAFNQKINC